MSWHQETIGSNDHQPGFRSLGLLNFNSSWLCQTLFDRPSLVKPPQDENLENSSRIGGHSSIICHLRSRRWMIDTKDLRVKQSVFCDLVR